MTLRSTVSGLLVTLLVALVFPLAWTTAQEPAGTPAGSGSPQGAAIPGAGDTPTPTHTPSPTSVPPPCLPPGPPAASRIGSPEIFGYLPYWDLEATIDYGAITTVAYFGLQARPDGTLGRFERGSSTQKTTEYSRWTGARAKAVVANAQAAGVKMVLTVERFAWNEASRTETRALLENPVARTALAADIVGEISTRGLDGVSLDFEPVLSDQRANFLTFMCELRAALDVVDPTLQLTFAATASQSNLNLQMFNKAVSTGVADAVIIMGYPLRGGDATRVGSIAPLYSASSFDLRQAVDNYVEFIPRDKIIMAIPWYGRTWPAQGPELHALRTTNQSLYGDPDPMGYALAIPHAIRHGRLYDAVEDSAYVVYPHRWCSTCPDYWRQIYYDDVEALSIKYDYLTGEAGLAGIGIWALGYDNELPEMWKLLRVKYRGLADTTPPTGTFGLAPDSSQCGVSAARLLFDLSDGEGGSGAVYIRLSNSAELDASGRLALARTYPATGALTFALDDVATGGSNETGDHSVYAQWGDVAGNWSSVSSSVVRYSAPAATLSVAGGSQFVAEPIVSVSIQSTGASPITAVRYSSSPQLDSNRVLALAVESVPTTPYAFDLTDPSTGGSTSDGARNVYAQWRDSLGCWSEPVSTTLILDRAAPTGTLSIAGSPQVVTSANIELLASGTDESGIVTLAISNDGASWTSMTPTDQPIAWADENRSDGPWTIYAKWRDGAGTWSDVATATILVDGHGPTGTIVLNNGSSTTNASTVRVDATVSDTASAVVEMLLSNSPTQAAGVLDQAASFATTTVQTWPFAGAGSAAGVSDGTHTVYAQWRDAVGNWSSIVSASVVVDRTPPQVIGPTMGFRTGATLQKTTAPIAGYWEARDDLTGVASSRLQLRPSSNPTSAPVFEATVSPAAIEVSRTGSWSMQVVAVDNAGNAYMPTGRSFTVGVQEDSLTAMRFSGTWNKATTTSASGGTTRYATSTSATVGWQFTGRAFAWVAPLGPKMGKAKVLIDGIVVAKVNLNTSKNQPRMLVFSRRWDASASHFVKIKVLSSRVDIDAFAVLR